MSAWLGLWAADTLQSAAFCARYLHLSIRAGMVSDIVKGLTSEAAFRTAESRQGHAFALRLIEHAETLLAEANDLEILAYIEFARGLALFSRGDLSKAITHLEIAVNHRLACTRRRPALEISQTFLGEAYSRKGALKALQHSWERWVAGAEETGNIQHLAICRMWPMGCVRWLAADQPDVACKQLDKGTALWPWPNFDMTRAQAYVSQSYVHLYRGEDQKAFDTCTDLMARVYKGPLRRIQMIRVSYAIVYSCAALAYAAVAKKKGILCQLQKNKLSD